MPTPALLPFELVLYFECFACSSVVLIIGEQWKCVSQRQISKPFKTHLLEKVVWRWRARSRKLQTRTTFANFPHWRHLTFYISTTFLNFSHPSLSLLWLWQRPSTALLTQGQSLPALLGGVEELAPKSELLHLIFRKFVLAQTPAITIWEVSRNGTEILRKTFVSCSTSK